jgi:hypothetical protein
MDSLKEGGPLPRAIRTYLYDVGLFIVTHPENKIYMSFVKGRNNAIEYSPTGFIQQFKEGTVVISTVNDCAISINLQDDSIIKECGGIKYKYNGTIYERNSSKGFTKII